MLCRCCARNCNLKIKNINFYRRRNNVIEMSENKIIFFQSTCNITLHHYNNSKFPFLNSIIKYYITFQYSIEIISFTIV